MDEAKGTLVENINRLNNIQSNIKTNIVKFISIRNKETLYRIPVTSNSTEFAKSIFKKLEVLCFSKEETSRFVTSELPIGFEEVSFKKIKEFLYVEKQIDTHVTFFDALFKNLNDKTDTGNAYTLKDHMRDMYHMLDNFRFDENKLNLMSDSKYCFRIINKYTQNYYLLEGTFKDYSDLFDHMVNIRGTYKNILLHTKYDGPIYFNYEDIKYKWYDQYITSINFWMTRLERIEYFNKLKDSIFSTICLGDFFIHN